MKTAKEKDDNRPWRTNIGLRLTRETGAWLEKHCQAENRTFANYVETLILRDKASHNRNARGQA